MILSIPETEYVLQNVDLRNCNKIILIKTLLRLALTSICDLGLDGTSIHPPSNWFKIPILKNACQILRFVCNK